MRFYSWIFFIRNISYIVEFLLKAIWIKCILMYISHVLALARLSSDNLRRDIDRSDGLLACWSEAHRSWWWPSLLPSIISYLLPMVFRLFMVAIFFYTSHMEILKIYLGKPIPWWYLQRNYLQTILATDMTQPSQSWNYLDPSCLVRSPGYCSPSCCA